MANLQNEHFYFWYFNYILMLILLYFYLSNILNAGLLLVNDYTVVFLLLLKYKTWVLPSPLNLRSFCIFLCSLFCKTEEIDSENNPHCLQHLVLQNETYYTASVTLFNTMDMYTSDSGTVENPKIRLEVPIVCSYMKSMLISADFGSMGYASLAVILYYLLYQSSWSSWPFCYHLRVGWEDEYQSWWRNWQYYVIGASRWLA